MSVESLAIVLHHSRASGTAKVVAIGIANHDGDGGAWPSIATLARYARVDTRSVQRAIGQLVALGEVVVHRQAGGQADYDDGRRPNLYELRITCPSDCDRSKHHRTRRTASTQPLPLRLATGDANDTPDASVTPTPDASVTPRGDAHAPLTIHGNHPENSCGPGSTSTTDRASHAPPAAESLAAIRNILSARRTS